MRIASPLGPVILLLAAVAVVAIAQPTPPALQPPPDPELERQSFQVADGFEVSLYAADPMLAKPIQMNFDPAGRLWIATSEVYPQIKPGEVADDKVLVLEDTKGAGKADKVTVFAGGLLIPTGVLPGDGGCYVANSTEVVHFRDTDGDGKADQRRVVLSGFGTEDTHHIIHTFRWGQDGIFYFNQSVYIHSHIETPYGPRRLAAGGTWAYRPQTEQLEVFTRGLINHWGHAWDKYGDSFFTDGAGGEGVNFGFPGVAFTSLNDRAPRVLPGLNPGSPKFAGAEIISGRHFPDDWQGDLITNDFRANRVARFKLSEDGAGFAAKLMPDLIRTKDKAFRPVDVKMGPDGALYIADWYNPIINHGEVDFRDARRDKTHGRIWRVTAKGKPLVDRPRLAGAPLDQLLDALRSPEDYTRRQARLVLREMDKATVTAALDKWTASLSDLDLDDFTRLQSLWTYQTMDVPNAALLNRLLTSTDPGIRAAATRVVGAWSPRLPDAFAMLKPLVADPHPRVRLEAVRALATIESPEAMDAAMSVLDHPMDAFLDYALYLTANDLQSTWLPAFQSGQLTFNRNPKKIEFALKAIRNPAAIKPLVAEFQSGKVAPESRKNIVELIAQLGAPEDLAVLFNAAVALQRTDPARHELFNALERAARQRKAKPDGNLDALVPAVGAREQNADEAAIRLAGAWRLQSARPAIQIVATAGQGTPNEQSHHVRFAAFDALAELGDVQTLKTIVDKEPAEWDASIPAYATASLCAADTAAAAPIAANLLRNPAMATSQDLAHLLKAFVQRKDGPRLLATALKSNPIPADNAKLALRAVYALGNSDPTLVAQFQSAAGISSQPKQLSPDDMTKLVAEVQTKGDPARGEQIFRRADTACLRCHSIAGAGGQLAPDLTSAGSAPVDYLVDSILQPNKAVKEGYHAIIVETKDGDQLTGIKVRQTDKELILRDAVQDEIVIPLADVKGKPREAGSMMPAGLADPLTRQELTDLVRFLSELGRPGPYAVSNKPTARRWETLTTPEALSAARNPTARLNLPAAIWLPDYATVSGALPAHPGLARCQVRVTTAGTVKFLLSKSSTACWIDDVPTTTSAAELTATLSPGVHTLTLAVPSDTTLRVELADLPNSPAKAQFVTGR